MAQAQAAGDISTIMRLISSTSSMTVTDFIQKTCGSLLFIYYTYVDKLHMRPVDLDDLIDGLLYLDARQYVIDQARARATK